MLWYIKLSQRPNKHSVADETLGGNFSNDHRCMYRRIPQPKQKGWRKTFFFTVIYENSWDTDFSLRKLYQCMLQALPEFTPDVNSVQTTGPWLKHRCSYPIFKSWISKSALKKLICQACLRIQEAHGNLLLKYFRTHLAGTLLYPIQHREAVQMQEVHMPSLFRNNVHHRDVTFYILKKKKKTEKRC